MPDITVATNGKDAQILERVISHHDEILGAIRLRHDALITAVNGGRDFIQARDNLAAYCLSELIPHATAEETTLYPAAASDPQLRTLVASMLVEHQLLVEVVDQLGQASQPGQAAAAAGGLWTLISSHVVKENEYVLPAIAASNDASLAELVQDLSQLIAGEASEASEATPAASAGGGGCGCGCAHTDETPELDVRDVPHAIRHATVFGALEAVAPGSSLILVAPHDPLPLLNQINDRHPNQFSVSYLERGPEAWRLELSRS